jgi:iron(III) transport system permease protein
MVPPCCLDRRAGVQPAPDVWQHLIDYVLPLTIVDTALLLGEVSALSLLIGAGSAWAISLHEFRGRRTLLWTMPLHWRSDLPGAYVYVDPFDRSASSIACSRGFHCDVVRLLPNLRSLPGAIIVIALVLYPTSIFRRGRCSSFRAEFAEAARLARHWTVFWRVSLPMARPALAVGVALVSLETLNDIGQPILASARSRSRSSPPGSIAEALRAQRAPASCWPSSPA